MISEYGALPQGDCASDIQLCEDATGCTQKYRLWPALVDQCLTLTNDNLRIFLTKGEKSTASPKQCREAEEKKELKAIIPSGSYYS